MTSRARYLRSAVPQNSPFEAFALSPAEAITYIEATHDEEWAWVKTDTNEEAQKLSASSSCPPPPPPEPPTLVTHSAPPPRVKTQSLSEGRREVSQPASQFPPAQDANSISAPKHLLTRVVMKPRNRQAYLEAWLTELLKKFGCQPTVKVSQDIARTALHAPQLTGVGKYEWVKQCMKALRPLCFQVRLTTSTLQHLAREYNQITTERSVDHARLAQWIGQDLPQYAVYLWEFDDVRPCWWHHLRKSSK